MTQQNQATITPSESVSSDSLSPGLHQSFNDNLSVKDQHVDDEQQAASDRKDMDALLAQEMNEMSLKEREKVYEELHGVDEVVKETPEFLEDRLQALDRELQGIPNKPAYDQAETMCYDYVNDPKFRLMFLRADFFNPEKAAIRLVKFMEGKLLYFGPESLARPIELNDLDANTQECLRSGIMQFLPSRDQAGRAVCCDLNTMYPRAYKVSRNLMLIFLYLLFCAAEDEETQRRGIVFLLYHMGPIRHKPDPEMLKEAAKALEWLPVRLSATHVCTDRTITSIYASVALLVAGKYVRARFRLHEGTHTEVQYSLMTFGIPIYLFPMTSEGELKLANHLKWIKKRQVKETLLTSFGFFDKVDMPNRNDILVGKGKPFQQHPGNVRLRQLVELRLADYTVARKSEKTNLTREIVQMIKDSSVRFLKRDLDGWWEEVSAEDAREKVSKTFGSTRVSSAKTLQIHGPGCLASGNQKRAKIETDGCGDLCVSPFV